MSNKEPFSDIESSCLPYESELGTTFEWSEPGVGFGQFYFYYKDGKLMCGNELMSKEFLKKQLCKMIDDCELDCVS